MRRATGPALVLLLVALLAALVPSSSRADAAPGVKPGLYAERSVAVDGATVRRIYDTEEKVVCYVATLKSPRDYDSYTASRSVAIACEGSWRQAFEGSRSNPTVNP